MRAYLINPHDQTITEVDYSGDYCQIYDLIECQTFDVARINDRGDVIYVDDEGMFHNSEFFDLPGYSQPLAGLGLVLGTNDEGESTSPSNLVTLNWLRDQTRFLNLLEVTA